MESSVRLRSASEVRAMETKSDPEMEEIKEEAESSKTMEKGKSGPQK